VFTSVCVKCCSEILQCGPCRQTEFCEHVPSTYAAETDPTIILFRKHTHTTCHPKLIGFSIFWIQFTQLIISFAADALPLAFRCIPRVVKCSLFCSNFNNVASVIDFTIFVSSWRWTSLMMVVATTETFWNVVDCIRNFELLYVHSVGSIFR